MTNNIKMEKMKLMLDTHNLIPENFKEFVKNLNYFWLQLYKKYFNFRKFYYIIFISTYRLFIT